MKSALLGYSGFVGSNLTKQNKFNDLYNSKNISQIKGKEYDLIISAANSSLMWKANLEPKNDWDNIENFMKTIKKVKTHHFVLLSTIEVYDNPIFVDEDSDINTGQLKPYGKHRYLLEEFVKKQFENYTIIRMPNLFGEGLKKNFIYDLIHNNRLDLTHRDNEQQWYDLKNIWQDISVAVKNDLQIVNFAVEPIDCRTLAKYAAGIDFTNVTEAPPRKYDMQTKYASLYQTHGSYLYNKNKTLKALKQFIKKEKSRL